MIESALLVFCGGMAVFAFILMKMETETTDDSLFLCDCIVIVIVIWQFVPHAQQPFDVFGSAAAAADDEWGWFVDASDEHSG